MLDFFTSKATLKINKESQIDSCHTRSLIRIICYIFQLLVKSYHDDTLLTFHKKHTFIRIFYLMKTSCEFETSYYIYEYQ
jgi:hypothetical protein